MEMGGGRAPTEIPRGVCVRRWLRPNLKNFQLNVMELIMLMSVITDSPIQYS